MAVSFEETASGPLIGKPQALFSRTGIERLTLGNGDRRHYDVTADGQRFVVLQAEQQESRGPVMTVVENWIRQFEDE